MTSMQRAVQGEGRGGCLGAAVLVQAIRVCDFIPLAMVLPRVLQLLAAGCCLGVVLAQDAPQAVRLAFAGTGVDMAVSWTTLGLTDTSVVQYVVARLRGMCQAAAPPSTVRPAPRAAQCPTTGHAR
jgi:hypothetical protein